MSDPARRAFLEAADRFGDPLRVHERGRVAHRVLEQAREVVASALGAQPDEIVFTSGGTESVTLALAGVPGTAAEGRIVVGAGEHPAVLGAAALVAGRGLDVSRVPVDEHGRIDVDRFAAEVRGAGTILASVQHASHEVGTMQPVAEAASLAHEAGVTFHSDACQTAGKLPIDVGTLGVDLLSVSGHKFGGPPGVGALYVRRGIQLSPLAAGDDRERRLRAGLQNLPAIAGMAAALREETARIADRAAEQWSLTTRLRTGIEEKVPGARLHGHPTQRTPHLVCFSVSDVDPEALLLSLDQRGFRLDAGSLSSGLVHEPSAVLAEMGAPDTVAFRASVGPGTREQDVDALVGALAELVGALNQMRA